MWTEGNYRRNLMDMHIDDWNEEFLSRINPEEYVEALADAHVQCAMVKAKPHTGLCYWPCETGRMHRGLKGRDFFGEMVRLCHKRGIAVIAYYSQIFDNWASDHHPDWRLVAPDGRTFREYRHLDQFRNGRYGICCPNNPGYRAYVKANLEELNRKYDFEGMFLDMTFWPEICTCPSCRKRFYEETEGKELPRIMDWNDPDFRLYAEKLDEWMADFAAFSTDTVKAVKPEVTVEHQFSRITMPWFNGSTEMLTEHVDYCGGDYYGGYLQQTFINKYYKSVSPSLPFVYHTGRCDPELSFHTTTKTEEQLVLHAVTALLHNGAFLLVDAINPDGSIVPEVYHGLMKRVYAQTMPIEPFVSGKLNTDVGIWFASRAKYDPAETGNDTEHKSFEPTVYMDAPVGLTSILRENNVPFDVLGAKNLRDYSGRVLALCHVSSVREEEMDAIEDFVNRGGSLYVSGPVGHPRLEKLLGIRVKGKTEHDFTYMDPAEDEGALAGFTKQAPMTVTAPQVIAEVTEGDVQVLATCTLPYAMTGTEVFSAIHSNPPGIHTGEPCITLRRMGESRCMWVAAPIETAKPFMSRQAVRNLIGLLVPEQKWTSNAPKFVEILSWEKNGETFFAAINEQEESPVVPMDDIWIEVPGNWKAVRMPDGEELRTVRNGDYTRILLPKLYLFQILKITEDGPQES
ncbi:MAG: alpha-L-fucosidase [Clostridiales bacterium]|nr:alpha-L-fucosidase [Clostridiales bacterium]